MKAPTLFMLTVPDGERARRGVMFPVATREARLICATTAHTVQGMTGSFQMIVADQAGIPFTPEAGCRGVQIIAIETDTDLALIEMEMDSIPKPVRLCDRRIAKDMTLYHARNVMFKNEFEGQACVFSEQVVSPMLNRFVLDDCGAIEVPDSARAQMRGRCLLRGLRMRSWPGVSGSPLWDRFGNVYGMVQGGNEELNERRPEFVLAYLPVENIRKSIQRFRR